ncbi:MAG: DNA-directed RNA polymerase subunit omega [Clostridiales bacterium]|nr:DNA-directed RNA polymerase subunit omega [Clostridiales bacterium]
MLLYPSVDLLKTKVDSKYTLVIMAAKRARDIMDGKPKLVDIEKIDTDKPVSVATAEIADQKISYKKP